MVSTENIVKTNVERPVFPFTAIIGQEEMKLALILNVIDPRIGGVMIMGDRGTGKSTTIRAVADLLPEIQVALVQWHETRFAVVCKRLDERCPLVHPLLHSGLSDDAEGKAFEPAGFVVDGPAANPHCRGEERGARLAGSGSVGAQH